MLLSVVQVFQNVYFLVFFLKNVLSIFILEKKVLHIDRNSFYGGEGASGHIFSDSHKQKISKSLLNRVFSPEHKEKISKQVKGRVWWNNGIINKHTRKRKLEIPHDVYNTNAKLHG